MNIKKIINILLSVGISVAFLYLAMKDIDFGVVVSRSSEVHLPLFLFGLFLWMVGYVLRGVRWQVYFSVMGVPITFWHSFKTLVMGFAANNVFPLRAGEVYRAYALHKLYPHISITKTFTTVVVERVLDGITVVFFTLVGSRFIPMPFWANQAVEVASVIFGVMFVLFILTARYPKKASKMFGTVTQVLPGVIKEKARNMFEQLIDGLMAFKSLKSLSRLMVLSFLIWSLEVCFYFVSFYALGINLSIGFAAFLMGIINLAIVIPAGPGGVGTYEYVTVLSFSLLGVSESLSFLYAIVTHGAAKLTVIALGLYYWYTLQKESSKSS